MSTLQNQIYMCIFSSTLQMAIVIQQHIKPYAIYFGIGDQSQVVCFYQCLTYSHSILLMAVFSFVLQEECQNHIRVIGKKPSGELFVCGTNAFKPKCRSYVKSEVGLVQYIIVE